MEVEHSQRKTTMVVFGRFQPFHNGHLEMLKVAAGKADRINVLISDLPKSRHAVLKSMRSEDNPFSFEDRKAMIENALLESGIPKEKFVVEPLVRHLVNLTFNHKADQTDFQIARHGHPSEIIAFYLKVLRGRIGVLDVNSGQTFSGTEIRKLIREKGKWGHMVPPSTATRIVEKLRRAQGSI